MQISYLRYDVGHCHKGLYSFVKKALLKHPCVSLYKGQLAYSSFIHHTHMPSHLFGQIPNREKKIIKLFLLLDFTFTLCLHWICDFWSNSCTTKDIFS